MVCIRRRWRLLVPLTVLITVALYVLWSSAGRGGYVGPPLLNLKQTHEYGHDSGAGNVVAIQPWMSGSDYSCRDAFKAKVDGYFAEAKRRHWLRPNTIVVLPEYFGAWLLCAGEKSGVWNASTVTEAMKTKILSNAPTISHGALTAPCQDRLRYAVFKASASDIASIYDDTLSSMARKYHVTIVGGSTILPSPSVVDGRLRSGSGRLFNVTPVYSPNGRLNSPLVTKVFITADEKSFLSAGNIGDLPVFDTPLGKMGVLICADSWFPQAYEELSRKHARLVIVPSFVVGNQVLDAKWDGYSGARPPLDVQVTDVGKISELEAWEKYALPGRLPRSGIPDGIMVCLGGRLWDLGSDPCGFVVSSSQPPKVVRTTDGASLVNVWLSRSSDFPPPKRR